MKKELKQQKMQEWSKLDVQQKIKYNGFNGYCNQDMWVDTSLFKQKKERNR